MCTLPPCCREWTQSGGGKLLVVDEQTSDARTEISCVLCLHAYTKRDGGGRHQVAHRHCRQTTAAPNAEMVGKRLTSRRSCFFASMKGWIPFFGCLCHPHSTPLPGWLRKSGAPTIYPAPATPARLQSPTTTLSLSYLVYSILPKALTLPRLFCFGGRLHQCDPVMTPNWVKFSPMHTKNLMNDALIGGFPSPSPSSALSSPQAGGGKKFQNG